MSAASSCTWPLRVSSHAAKDFDNLIKNHRDKVLECLTNPIVPGKWKKLESKHDLWRMHVDHAVRLVVNIQRGVAYVWRILDRKDVYRILRNQNPGHALTGITIEEFLMKAGAKSTRVGKDNGAKPAANGNGHGGGLASPPAAGPAPAGDDDNIRPPSHPLLNALSQYFSDHARSDVDAILAIVEDRVGDCEDELLSLGEKFAALDAREGDLSTRLTSQVESTERIATSQDGLAQNLNGIRTRLMKIDEGLAATTNRLDGELSSARSKHDREIVALSDAIDLRIGELLAACEEDRTNSRLGFSELGRQVELLSSEGETLRVATDAHESSINRLEGEVSVSAARLEGLAHAVAGLNEELERLRSELSNRSTLRRLAILATRVRAALSPRGVA